MVIEYIRYNIPSEQQESFVTAYRRAAAALDESTYCLGYELTHCEEDKTKFILRIRWTSTADHLNGFRKSPAFRGFLQHVRPYFNCIEEMNHYALTDVIAAKEN
ncbi:heme-degrading monooxygenase HmoA [Lewinella aquimaris]|uniref:Heme-degrading monooxygenase HmoA n=1 Tax=Neolewinella aquimaris TaxID=1835722 RepID=A0A840ECB3_9BACT|nr:antibiotic biosynthesis monooxygenase family protein [Neolewinella aquimaris]MBB4079439.1 heme-degrading monooxygenase HmoA [Neolewinella aquimaris]